MAKAKAEQLKKCPLCEGEAESDFSFDHNDKTYFYVVCLKCGANTGRSSTEAKAITAWETRPLEDALAGALEKILASVKVRAFAKEDDMCSCDFCGRCAEFAYQIEHSGNCNITIAKEALEKYKGK